MNLIYDVYLELTLLRWVTDLINKVSVGPVVVHHQYHASQLKSSFSSSKDLPFGPKYTGEGKIDFYEQNKKERHFEEEKAKKYNRLVENQLMQGNTFFK